MAINSQSSVAGLPATPLAVVSAVRHKKTMSRFLHYLLFVIALSSALPVLASQEGLLRLDKFQFSSPGIGQSGPVVVSSEQDSNQVVSLTVQAFGRTVCLSKDQLAKLRGGFINGTQISYEAGYRKLGGRTIYLILAKGFASGLRETQLVSVNEQGAVEVNDVVRK